MSRSNPQDSAVNPATRWFEWNGEKGLVRYYDKEAKRNVDIGDDFTFLLLDQLGSVGGWNEASESAIYSNQVRDISQDLLIVKSFKGGILAEGVYREIKERVTSRGVGGQYIANCYVAYKDNGGGLKIGVVQFKGSSLHAWAEFTKAHRADVYKKAIRIKGSVDGKKGRIEFKTPVFHLTDTSPATDAAAVELDKELQAYLSVYLKKTKRDQVESAAAPHVRDEDVAYDDPPAPEITEDDIPF